MLIVLLKIIQVRLHGLWTKLLLDVPLKIALGEINALRPTYHECQRERIFLMVATSLLHNLGLGQTPILLDLKSIDITRGL